MTLRRVWQRIVARFALQPADVTVSWTRRREAGMTESIAHRRRLPCPPGVPFCSSAIWALWLRPSRTGTGLFRPTRRMWAGRAGGGKCQTRVKGASAPLVEISRVERRGSRTWPFPGSWKRCLASCDGPSRSSVERSAKQDYRTELFPLGSRVRERGGGLGRKRMK
jgi:hypothetical protein